MLASSGAVYGSLPSQPLKESDTPQPETPYAVSKLAAEQYVHTIGQLWGMESVALRIFNAYGPHQNLPVSHAPVVPRFLRQATTGGSVVLFGGGQQTRDFVYVTDVVAALVAASTAVGVNRQVLNIGSGQETSIQTLVHTIEQVLHSQVNQLDNSERNSGVSRLVADISLAQTLLNYTPQVTLPAGLQHMLNEDDRFAHARSTAVG